MNTIYLSLKLKKALNIESDNALFKNSLYYKPNNIWKLVLHIENSPPQIIKTWELKFDKDDYLNAIPKHSELINIMETKYKELARVNLPTNKAYFKLFHYIYDSKKLVFEYQFI